jgi:hypothetical protein
MNNFILSIRWNIAYAYFYIIIGVCSLEKYMYHTLQIFIYVFVVG